MQANIESPPVRLALIGAGIFAKDAHVPSLLRLPDNFELMAIYSRTAASATVLAQAIPHPVKIYTDLAALLADSEIEAVDIVLPIDAMPGAVTQALASGKHVLSEKPIAGDVATARRLLAAYTQREQQVWMVGENYRYEDAYLQAADLVRRGEIGRPATCHLVHYAPVLPSSKYYHSAWRRSGAFPGGYILDGGIHQVAALRLLLGEVTEVSAVVTQVAPDLPPADTISATLRFASGVLGVYLASYAVGAPWSAHLHIAGDQGALRVLRGEIELTKQGATQTMKYPAYDGVQKELAAFAAAIRTGAPHRNPPEEALRDLAVIEAMLHAAGKRAGDDRRNGVTNAFMPIRYWLFVGLMLLVVGTVGYGVYTTNRLLRAWQPDRNLLLIPGENLLRLVLIALCIGLGLLSGLDRTQLGWMFERQAEQWAIGSLWGGGLALFFYASTRWVMRHNDQRFYSTVVIKAIVPHNRRELLLVMLAMIPVVGLEELLFRSLLLGGLTPLLPAFILVLASGLLFGILHIPQGLWGVTGAAAAGILFGFLFLHEGSLLMPFVAHYITNAVQVGQAMRLREQL